MKTARIPRTGAIVGGVRSAGALLASDTSALMLSNLCSALIGILTGLVTARALGPAGRGDLAVVIFWPSLLTSFLDAGISESITIRIARAPNLWRRQVRSGLTMAAAASVLATAIGYAAVPLILQTEQGHLVSLTRMALAFVPASLCSAVSLGTLLGLHRFKAVALIRVANVVLYLGTLLVAVFATSAEIEVIAYMTVASRVFPALAGGTLILAGVRSIGPWDLKRHVRDAASLQSARTITVLAGSEDRILAALTLTQTAIGQWQVVAALTSVMQFVAQAVSQRLLSHVVATRATDSAIPAAYARAVILTGACAALAIPVLPFAIPLLYGPGFAPAVAPGMVIIAASVLGAGTMTLQAASRARADVRACLVSETAGMFAMFVVAVPASIEFGLMGVAGGCLAGRMASLAWIVRATIRRGDADLTELLMLTRMGVGRSSRGQAATEKDRVNESGASRGPTGDLG